MRKVNGKDRGENLGLFSSWQNIAEEKENLRKL